MALSLFRKYRPETFSQFVGQEHVAQTLLRAIATNSTADAYLFSGPRGTGKTSTARLLAKALLCEHAVAGEPDDTCEQCREISAGVHPDVYELDAASRTGVENVRDEIISRTAFSPIRGRFKIYIIDEVHMLSTAAFNALLKTLEEPPAHIKFILCTTDPQKVPQTIQSRCQRFDFRRFSDTEIIDNLRRISQAEGFQADDEALALITAHASGGMRDALVALEQIAVYANGDISVEAARSMLGQIRPEQLYDLVNKVAARDIVACFASVAELVQSGTDITQFTRELTRYLRGLYVASVLQEDSPTEVDWIYLDKTLSELQSAAYAFGSFDRLAACLAIAAELIEQLKESTDDRLAMELALIRMARPQSDLTLEGLSARIDALEAAVTRGGAPVAPAVAAPTEPAPAAEPAPAEPVARAPAEPAEPVPTAETVTSNQPDVAPGERIEQDTAGESGLPNLHEKIVSGNAEAQRIWSAVVTAMRRDKRERLLSLLTDVRVSTTDDGKWLEIDLPASAGFNLKSLEDPNSRKTISEYVERVHGSSLGINIKLGYQSQSSSSARATAPGVPEAPGAAQPSGTMRSLNQILAATTTEQSPATTTDEPVPDAEPATTTATPASAAPAPTATPAISAAVTAPVAASATPEDYIIAAFGDNVQFEHLPNQDSQPDDDIPAETNDQTLSMLDEDDLS
ncbi:MAG: DNA polymerase III subunit gamma/tau [Coriobacteriia bacterium]|nr:DNA polymerase III subunit gamma/tau [Coriobacteriia bacterium]